MKYVLNPNYVLLNDTSRIILKSVDQNHSGFSFLHPLHASMLAFFDGKRELEETLSAISLHFGINTEDAHRIITPLLDNEKDVFIKFEGTTFRFSEHILTPCKHGQERDDLNPNGFQLNQEYDFKTKRFNRPYSIYYVINTHCKTDCIYCYANKGQLYKPLATNKILYIIEDAKQTGIREFDISGGEFLLQKDWDVILKRLVDCRFNPNISTKVPFTEKMVQKLVDSGIKEIQVSVDTFSPSLIGNDLRVPSTYIDEMKQGLRMADEAGIRLILKGTQTKETLNSENIKEILDFARTLHNIKRYTISTIGYMQYKPKGLFKEIHPTIQQVAQFEQYLETVQPTLPFDCYIDNQTMTHSQLCNKTEFDNRGLCSGNTTGFVLLPDGKVTLCEELYWDPQFLMGDLTTQSIMEMWQSERAWKLWKVQQKSIPHSSACSHCKQFESCRYQQGVCWKMIINAYGRENSFYPDPRCPQAPPIKNNICYD